MPDYTRDESLYNKLGSSMGVLTRLPDGESLQKDLPHYASNQEEFAYLTRRSLLGSIEKYNVRDIFDLNNPGVSAGEINKIEDIYKNFSEDRLEIAEYTAGEDGLSERLRGLLQYTKSYNGMSGQQETATKIKDSIEGMNSKYAKYNEVFGKNLTLKSCVEIIGCDPNSIDRDIILGNAQDYNNGDGRHIMGSYRNGFRKDQVDRVDEVTALAAKEAYRAQENGDEEKSVKCALVFLMMRGYNVRSFSGACWAEEMSGRWLMDSLGMEQFTKAPGFYPDIEGCCEIDRTSTARMAKEMKGDYSKFSSETGQLERLVNNEVREYRDNVNSKSEGMKGSYFESKLPVKEKEFDKYLTAVQKFEEGKVVSSDVGSSTDTISVDSTVKSSVAEAPKTKTSKPKKSDSAFDEKRAASKFFGNT